MARHTERGGPPLPTLLLGAGADPQQAAQARAEGADLIDVRAATPGALAAIRASLPAGLLWTGPPGDPVDADRLARIAASAPGVAARISIRSAPSALACAACCGSPPAPSSKVGSGCPPCSVCLATL